MLARASRLTTGRDFSETIRSGHRAGSWTLVVHLALRPGPDDVADPAPARAGFVVARSVGGAVTRNRVQRRLRHLVREPLSGLPDNTRLVVRALPASAAATSPDLDRDLHSCLDRALAKALASSPAGAPS